MKSGAEIVLQAPLVAELIDPKAVRLLRGNLSLKVPDEGIGFRVITPTTDLVDMGTEFGAAVEESGATEVHVARGVVVVRSTTGSGVVSILSREAGRVDVPRDENDMSHGDFMSIGFDPSRFRGLSTTTAAAGKDESRAAGDLSGPIPPGARVIFLGDRATSRETHLLLINQALADLPDAVAPRLFNAGFAFRLHSDEPKFQEKVAALRPTHAVLEYGPEIAASREPWKPCTVEQFQKAITRLVDRLQQAGIEPIIATGFVVSNEYRAAEGLLRQYNEVLRELARSRKLRLADVDRLVRQSSNASRLTGAYDIPTFEGFRIMAAGVLDAMGYPNAHVPEALQLGLLPGVLTEWKSRLKPSTDSLDSQRALTLEPGKDWTTLKAPQQDDLSERLPVPSQSFLWQDRMRGYVLHKNWGTANQVEAIAYVDSPTEREAFLNTGGNLKTVWLNGRRLFDRGRDWTGWHPGKERIPVRLQAGRNKIVVEAENLFFVSVTDARDWPLPRPAVGSASAGKSP